MVVRDGMGVPSMNPSNAFVSQAVLDSVERHGRLFELGMVGRYKLKSLDFFSGAALGMKMVAKGKLRFLPSGIKGKQEVRKMFKKKGKG